MSRTLLLLRHASAGVALGRTDHARGLSAEGMAEAAAAGRALADHTPDLVVCSSAMRAQQTAACLQLTTTPVLDPEVYLATADGLLARIRQVPDTVSTLLLVGHNPGLGELAATLDDDPRLQRGFPTAALAVFALGEEPWAEVRSGRLVDLVTPGA